MPHAILDSTVWTYVARMRDRVIVGYRRDTGLGLEREAREARGDFGWTFVVQSRQVPPFRHDGLQLTHRRFGRVPAGAWTWQVYPDGEIGPLFHETYLPAFRDRIEAARHALDDGPIALPDDPDHAVRSAAFEHWGGLFARAALHRSDPAYPLRRVLLPRVRRDTGAAAGQHEVQTAAELEALVRARLERHNETHNARHLVEAEVAPLLAALEAAWDVDPSLHARVVSERTVDDAAFREAHAALHAYDIEARFAHYADAALHAAPTVAPVTVEALRQRDRLEAAAAARVSALLGATHTWSALLTLTAYDTAGLLAIVAEGKTRIATSETVEAVQAAADAAADQIAAWRPPLSVAVSHTPLDGRRGVSLVVAPTAPVVVRLASLAVLEPPSTPGKAPRKAAENEFYVGPLDEERVVEHPASMASPAVFPITLYGDTDWRWTAHLTVRLTDAGPVVHEREYQIGAVEA